MDNEKEISEYIKRSISDIARKCHVTNIIVIKIFMQEQLEQLLIDMRDSADYTGNDDLQYYAEELEKIIRKNF